MDIALDLLKWASIALAGLVAIYLAAHLMWRMLLGIIFVAGFPIMGPWNAVLAFRNRRGFNPLLYVLSAEEIEEYNCLSLAVDQTHATLENVRAQHEDIPRKKDGDIDFRYGGARELDESMQRLPSKLDQLTASLKKVADAPHERARRWSAPHANLYGYGIALGFGLCLFAIWEIIASPSQKFSPVAFNILSSIPPTVIMLIGFGISAAAGRLGMTILKEMRAVKMLEESEAVVSQHGTSVQWINEYQGDLQRRLLLN